MRLPHHTTRTLFVALAIVIFAGAGFASGYGVANKQNTEAAPAVQAASGVSLDSFWESWGILNKRFYGEISDQKRIDGAIGGMVAGLGDPYTAYFPKQQDKIFREDLQGKFGGIGAQLELRNGLVTVVAPLHGTPAETAGLKAGDVILKINQTSTEGIAVDDAVSQIRGEKGTKVTLTIGRAGQKSFDIDVVRDTIVVKSVVEGVDWNDPEIAYIKINQFGDDTASQFSTFLSDTTKASKKGIIIDLRNNPGGFLEKAIQMIGMVIPEKPVSDIKELSDRVVVMEKYKDKADDRLRATNAPINTSIPIVLLVNGGSASASEIMAGALRDYGRATMIGTKTFGKGSVQDLVELKGGGSVKVTIAHWLTPKGTEINGKGIEPDVVLDLPADVLPSTTDVQVQKALEILKK
jgi:carboxyl-terminal processing protease